MEQEAYLGVIPGLQCFSIVSLASAFGSGYEVIQAVIDDCQVRVEPALARDQVLGKGQIPVGNVKSGSVFSLFQHPIHSLQMLEKVAGQAGDAR